jgi:hypothetical protein
VIESFIAITRDIIAEDGIGEFLPTLMLPAHGDVRLLENASGAASHESEALKWVQDAVSPDEDFLLAYRIDEKHFKVVSRSDGRQDEQICLSGDG